MFFLFLFNRLVFNVLVLTLTWKSDKILCKKNLVLDFFFVWDTLTDWFHFYRSYDLLKLFVIVSKISWIFYFQRFFLDSSFFPMYLFHFSYLQCLRFPVLVFCLCSSSWNFLIFHFQNSVSLGFLYLIFNLKSWTVLFLWFSGLLLVIYEFLS